MFFLKEGGKGYRRLTKSQAVGLRHAGYVISVKSLEKDGAGRVVGITARCEHVDKVDVKPKAFIHWVGQPVDVEVRLYSSL